MVLILLITDVAELCPDRAVKHSTGKRYREENNEGGNEKVFHFLRNWQ